MLFIGSDQTTEAENYDRFNITLAGVQEELVAAVVAANPKTVVVLINGGPLAIESVKETVPAIIGESSPSNPLSFCESSLTVVSMDEHGTQRPSIRGSLAAMRLSMR